jgi:hypothetical protein
MLVASTIVRSFQLAVADIQVLLSQLQVCFDAAATDRKHDD